MITQELLKELLHYDPSTGVFTWKRRDEKHFKSCRSYRRWNAIFAGIKAGTICSNDYIAITIKNKYYLAHRLAWLYVFGRLPSDQIDHINGTVDDNRIKNLREVSHSENMKNKKKYNANKLGCTGVTWNKRDRAWQTHIRVNRNLINLGYFCDWFEAVCARKSAENKYGFHVNHGRR